MLAIISDMLSSPFIVRALIAGSLISLCSSLLGVSLVLKRCSMIGDGLSHVGFGALAVAAAMGTAPIAFAVPVVIAAAFLLLRIGENSKIKGDAAIALISVGSLAVGVTVVYKTTNSSLDISHYMFGSVNSISKSDLPLCIGLTAVVLILYVFFYSKIFAVNFDENFAKATGMKTGLYNMLIAALTAVTIVLGMRLMGALLVSALIVFPSLSAMRVFKSFFSVVVGSAVLSLICFFAGMIISYELETPAGASVVIVNIAAFILFSGVGVLRGWLK